MRRIPSLRHHKPSGRAVVTLNGRDHYLGVYGTEAAEREYNRVIAEWLAAGRVVVTRSPDVMVKELAAAYLAHAKGRMGRDDYTHAKLSLRVAVDLYAERPARDFGPLALRAVRQRMLDTPNRFGKPPARSYVNKHVSHVVRAWKWAVAQELVPAPVYDALRCVPGLRAGEARDTPKVRPPAVGALEAVLPHLGKVPRDLITLISLTGMRAGEASAIRPMDVSTHGIDPDGAQHHGLWVYVPQSHKTAHRGHQRVIFLGHQAQRLLAPYLDRPADRYCFRPCEAVLHHTGKRKPGERYRASSLGHALAKACKKAGVRFTLHQLRHSAGTSIRAAFGPEHSRAALGHKTIQANEVYSEIDRAKAAEVARKIG